MLGFECGELVGKTIFDIIPPEDVPRLEGIRAALLAPGQVREGMEARRKDGTLIPVDVSANILPGGRWQAFVRDISETRRAVGEREGLLAREQLARRQAETASQNCANPRNGFGSPSTKRRSVWRSSTWMGASRASTPPSARYVGYTAHELSGCGSRTSRTPKISTPTCRTVVAPHRGEIPRYQREMRYIRKDGSVVTILLNTSMLRGLDGAPRYFISRDRRGNRAQTRGGD